MDVNTSIESIFEQLKLKMKNNIDLHTLLDLACEKIIYTINNKNQSLYGDLLSQMEISVFDENLLKLN